MTSKHGDIGKAILPENLAVKILVKLGTRRVQVCRHSLILGRSRAHDHVMYRWLGTV